MSIAHTEGHSATVEIRLEIDGLCLDVSQVGSTSFILSETRELKTSTSALLVVTVDGDDFPYPIHIYRVEGDEAWFF